jgi:hypothetical protein
MKFQIRLQKKIRELHFEWFHKEIIRSLNHNIKNSISNIIFLERLSEMLHIPSSVVIDQPEKDLIILDANRTINGIYNLLGSSDVGLNPIEWHTDFKTGFKWPSGTFYKKYIQENIKSDSDVKVPRELSRGHHLLKSALAYVITGKKEYSEVCVAQMNNWIEENPLMFSINWGCTMDVAIRAVNWIWTLGLIKGSGSLDSISTERIKGSLYQHGWFTYRNPEISKYYNGNHYLSDLTGQIYLALLFSGMEEPEIWLEKGKAELFREIRLQILPTGMSFERSTHYNRLVLELILFSILILKKNNQEIPSDIWYRLEKMFEFLMYSLKPDGTSPIIGDKDNGRLLPFGAEETNNFKYLLSLGALLFNRSDFKQHGDGFNVYCSILAGDDSLERWNTIPDLPAERESKAFPDAGLYIMRGKNDYLIFNATGKGKYPELGPASHTHSDLFSFELFTLGKSFLIDPGTYLYTSDADMRMLYRSTKMHNTVTVDGESQNRIRRDVLWDFSRDAIPEVLKWESNSGMDKVTAIHNGYCRLKEPVTHQRTIIFDKDIEKWMIEDIIDGRGFHTVEWFFHFDTGIDFTITGNVVKTTCEDKKNIVLAFDQMAGLILRKEKSFISKSYGIKEDGHVLVAMIKVIMPLKFSIEIKKIH